MLSAKRCLLLWLVASAMVAFAQSGGENPQVGLISTQAVAFNPVNDKVYVVDQRQGSVSEIDAVTNSSSSIEVGARPDAIAIDVVNGRVYVANSRLGTVSVIDPNEHAVTDTVPAGPHPYVLAVNSSSEKVYVTNTFSDVVAVIDEKTNKADMIHAGSADNVAVDSKTGRVLLIGYEDPNIRTFSEALGSIQKTLVGEHLWGLSVNAATGAVYVTRTGKAELIEIKSGQITSVPVGATPCAVAVNPQTNSVYVANYADSTVSVIDGTTHTAMATIPVGLHPQALAIDSAANLVYVANTHGNSVSVIDGAKQTVIATLPAGENPFAIAAIPNRRRAVVANLNGPSYTIIDVAGR